MIDRILDTVARATYRHRWYTVGLSLIHGGLSLYLDYAYGLSLSGFIHWKLYQLQTLLCGC